MQVDRLGDAADGELAVEDDVRAVDRLHAGAAVLEGRVLLRVQEVGALHVPVPLLLAAVEAGRQDRRGDGRLQRVLTHRDRRGRLAELAPHLADHEVAYQEADALVVRVQLVGTRHRDHGAVVLAAGDRLAVRHRRTLPVGRKSVD